MKTAKEFLREEQILGPTETQWIIRFQTGRSVDLVNLISEYAKQAIERAAEKAEIKIEIVSETPKIDENDNHDIDVESRVVVDKQSILSVIEELK